MNVKLRAYLELVRPPNLFTAAADVVAGFACNGGELRQWPTCLSLVMSSMCLYASGVALNDACDAERDRLERPNRPIPSGRVPRRRALLLALCLMWIGVGLAIAVSAASALIAASLAAAIVLYDVVTKSTPAAPAVMGLCRALNLTLGMLGAAARLAPHSIAAIGLTWLYISSVTLFARDEAGESSWRRLGVGLCGVVAAIVGLLPLTLIASPHDPTGWLLVLGLLVIVGPPGRRALRQRTPHAVQSAVKAFILGLVGFDAIIAWLGAGWVGGLLLGALILPTVALARLFRVT